MAYSINGKLKVAVSSRALFQLEKEDEIFLKKGKEAYERYQVKHEKDVLQPGAAFPVVKALLELGEDDVEVIVVSRKTLTQGAWHPLKKNGREFHRYRREKVSWLLFQ